jgi:hypothetical protein
MRASDKGQTPSLIASPIVFQINDLELLAPLAPEGIPLPPVKL